LGDFLNDLLADLLGDFLADLLSDILNGLSIFSSSSSCTFKILSLIKSFIFLVIGRISFLETRAILKLAENQFGASDFLVFKKSDHSSGES
jgi:hypothetical protein